YTVTFGYCLFLAWDQEPCSVLLHPFSANHDKFQEGAHHIIYFFPHNRERHWQEENCLLTFPGAGRMRLNCFYAQGCIHRFSAFWLRSSMGE
uniref:Uncharacterized protein n=1 Tax=Chrysemys picta bellii TaxID=8478 RepID=A0A8C3HPW0_CHRPI